jgi:drug/metabolite transporter (DMT)-like permease
MLISMNFTLIAIASALLAAIANILARTLLKDLKAKNIVGINFLTMGATLMLISPMFYFFDPSIKTISLLIVIGFIDTLANYYYFKVFEKTEASVATPILSLAPVFTFFFGWILLSEKVTITTFILSILIVLLIIWFSADKKTFSQFKIDTLKPALIASFLFGLSAIPAKELLTNEAAINSPTLYMYRAALIAMFSLIFFNFQIKGISTKQYRLIFFRGLFVIGQWLLLYYALTAGSAGVTITLANITPVFVFILGALFLKEAITTKKLLAALSVVILSLLL